jgi:hypothetical protein
LARFPAVTSPNPEQALQIGAVVAQLPSIPGAIAFQVLPDEPGGPLKIQPIAPVTDRFISRARAGAFTPAFFR